jgi:hypothetical protein
MLSMCMPHPAFQLLSHVDDVHGNALHPYAIRGHPITVNYSFQQSLTTIWRTCEFARRERHWGQLLSGI